MSQPRSVMRRTSKFRPAVYLLKGTLMAFDLSPADTRVFLFHSVDAADDASAAMDAVNTWLGKDRSGSPYANLRVRDITVTPDGRGGVYATVVCTLGKLSAGSVQSSSTSAPRDQFVEGSGQ